MIDLNKIKNAEDWREKREEIKRQFLSYLGEDLLILTDPLYDEIEEDKSGIFVPHTKVIDESVEDEVRRYKIEYSVQEDERIMAWVFAPERSKKESTPAILCCHDAISQGKDELSGIEGDSQYALARDLAYSGYITMVPDCLYFGERKDSKRSNSGKNNKVSYQGKILMDYLAGLRVFGTWFTTDITSIGVLGKGFGALQAILLTAIEPMIQACVAIGPLSSWKDKKSKYNWLFSSKHDLIPELRKKIERGEEAFDIEHILALCATSAVLIINPSENSETSAKGKTAVSYLKGAEKIYDLLGMPEALHIVQRKTKSFRDTYLSIIEDWFAEWL
ncbi:MAG TPA: dienelactone hydrolase family protein [Candidatus Hydrogenedens sp.]|nr:dienelactone hydrolase family protein [Candidatus Hydrogenedens sp.]HOL20718.1 dienelactone hydrolase family protein [Candidatus Hydrogenedens sp.]HPP58554.1 dienelactone hydrolase family protein [Candidatus Hydrogenedens sp.]